MSDQQQLHYKETEYGFEFGAASVTRVCSDEKKGWVAIQVASKKQYLQIYVTKTGKIRVHSGDGEWFCQKKTKAKKSAPRKSSVLPKVKLPEVQEESHASRSITETPEDTMSQMIPMMFMF